MPWIDGDFGIPYWEEEIDYSTRPELAPPGSTWNPDPENPYVGNWVGAPTAAETEQPTTTTTTTDTDTPTTTTPTDSGGSGGTPTSFSFPTFAAPPLPTIAPFQRPNPYEYTPFAEPAAFSYDAFSAPTLAQAEQEPGYDFARREGLRALENSASARGILRTGGTLKDFIGWGNKFAEQNYGNVYNRAANTYGMNRQNAFDTFKTNRDNSFQTHQTNELGKLGAWNTNFGADKDVFDRNTQNAFDLYDRDFQGKLAEFNPRFRSAELTFSDLFNRWKAQLDATTSIATAGAGL